MNHNKPDYSDVESRRPKHTSRRMSPGRRLAYAIGKPLLRSILFLLTSSYRFSKVGGSDIADRILANPDRVYVPVYWHGQQIGCSCLIRDWIRRGFRVGYIISASVDGEVPADIARSWGAEVIRGSAQDTGALVLRDALAMMRKGVSIATMSDGPLGPKHEVKTGTVLMARMSGAAMIPIACAASSAWTMNTWDAFMIPKPFARVALAVGKPVEVPRTMSVDDIEDVRQEMQQAMEAVQLKALQQLS